MTALTDRLMDNLRVELPGALDGALQLAIWNVLNELCETADCWRERLTVTLSTNSREFTLGFPSGSDLVRVLHITHNGIPLNPTMSVGGAPTLTIRGNIAADVIVDDTATYDPDEVSGASITGYALFEPAVITLPAVPSAAAAAIPLLVDVSLKPSLDLTTAEFEFWVPDAFWATHHTTIMEGTLGRMKAQPAKPYSDKQMAAYHMRRFRNGMALARPLEQRKQVYGAQPWRFPRGGSIR